jgi:uncharacterized integral membrane protein (TIGR00697 family)
VSFSAKSGPPPLPAFRYLDLVTAFFVAVLIISNVASAAKIVDAGLVFFGAPLAFDGGTLLFPLSYVFGDVLTEVYGFRCARRVIRTGFAALALSALSFFLLRALPGEAAWEAAGGSAAYETILGGLSSGGIVLASLAGYWAGQISNALILSRMKTLTRGRFLWVRTMTSTLAGELLDSLAFVFFASLTGVFPWSLFVSLVFTNYLIKCAVEALMTPLTYLVTARLKRAEGVDVYDREPGAA